MSKENPVNAESKPGFLLPSIYVLLVGTLLIGITWEYRQSRQLVDFSAVAANDIHRDLALVVQDNGDLIEGFISNYFEPLLADIRSIGEMTSQVIRP